VSAKKRKKGDRGTYVDRIIVPPPEKQSAGCLASLPVVPIAVSLVLVTAKKITKRGERL
jgi:hypothetical protein